MPLCGGTDAGWDMAAIIFRSLECLLRVVGVVRDAIWRAGIEVVDHYWVVNDLVRCHNLCEIINGELDRRASTNCGIANSVLPRFGDSFIGMFALG